MSITDNVFVIKPLSLRYKLALLCLYLGFHKTHFSFASQIPARVSQKGGCMRLCAHSLGQVGCFAAPWTYPWRSSGKNTGVGCRFPPQGAFPTQE